jgi:hypothetical protein
MQGGDADRKDEFGRRPLIGCLAAAISVSTRSISDPRCTDAVLVSGTLFPRRWWIMSCMCNHARWRRKLAALPQSSPAFRVMLEPGVGNKTVSMCSEYP